MSTDLLTESQINTTEQEINNTEQESSETNLDEKLLDVMFKFIDEVTNSYETNYKSADLVSLKSANETLCNMFKTLIEGTQKFDEEYRPLFIEPMEKIIRVINLFAKEINIKEIEEEAMMTDEQKFEKHKKDMKLLDDSLAHLIKITASASKINDNSFEESTIILWKSFIEKVSKIEESDKMFKEMGMKVEDKGDVEINDIKKIPMIIILR